MPGKGLFCAPDLVGRDFEQDLGVLYLGLLEDLFDGCFLYFNVEGPQGLFLDSGLLHVSGAVGTHLFLL